MMKFLVVHFRAPVSRYHLRFQSLMRRKGSYSGLWSGSPSAVREHARMLQHLRDAGARNRSRLRRSHSL